MFSFICSVLDVHSSSQHHTFHSSPSLFCGSCFWPCHLLTQSNRQFFYQQTRTIQLVSSMDQLGLVHFEKQCELNLSISFSVIKRENYLTVHIARSFVNIQSVAGQTGADVGPWNIDTGLAAGSQTTFKAFINI